MSTSADLLIHARWIVPIEPYGAVLHHHALEIKNGTIVSVLPSEEARTRVDATQTVELPDHVLMPGLVNLHVHAPMTLLRGIADDLPLMRWLEGAIWPAERAHVSPAFVRDGATLAAVEMLRGGITTCNEMYFHPDAAAEAFDFVGMRAVVGVVILDFPTPYASDAADYLRKGLAARDRWRGHERIRFSIAPHAPYTVSDDSLLQARTMANELGLPLHMHVHESADEVRDAIAAYGKRPLARLARLGMLGSDFIAVHAVHLDDHDVDLLSHHGVSIAHCPTSNMKLASGIAPVARLDAAGLRIGLGTDGAASNNRLDLFQEMRHASLLAKVSTFDATALPAHKVLRMATLNGAQALGLDGEVGSLIPGKQADLCAIDLGGSLMRPCFDPVSHLIHVAGREQVSHVWIGGELRVNKGVALLQISDKELLRLAALWQTKLAN